MEVLAANNEEEEVDRLKMEIREVKALIWEGRMKLSATSDGEERQFLREEQRWLFDETRKIRDEVRLRLEARNIWMAGRYAAAATTIATGSSSPPTGGGAALASNTANSITSRKMPMLQRPDTPAAAWVFPPDFVAGCGWPPPVEQHVDVPTWTHSVLQPQRLCHKPRLPPLRPRKDGEVPSSASCDLAMQSPKSNGSNGSSKKRRNSHSAAAADIKEEQNGERGKRPRWKDHWVMQLIQVRGGMQEEFSKPPKQGVDLWRQVYTKLVASCPDFDKEPEACRKKWKMLVTEYKAASINTVTNIGGTYGGERPNKCRYYGMMNEVINVKLTTPQETSELDCVDTKHLTDQAD